MDTRTTSFLHGLGASVVMLGMMLPGSSAVPAGGGSGMNQASRLADRAAEPSPDIFHHWPNAAASVADATPGIFHHWPNTTVKVANVDPSIFHHWPNAAVSVAGVGADVLHRRA